MGGDYGCGVRHCVNLGLFQSNLYYFSGRNIRKMGVCFLYLTQADADVCVCVWEGVSSLWPTRDPGSFILLPFKHNSLRFMVGGVHVCLGARHQMEPFTLPIAPDQMRAILVTSFSRLSHSCCGLTLDTANPWIEFSIID